MGYVENLRSIIGTMPINLVATTVVVLNDKEEIFEETGLVIDDLNLIDVF
jgi:hypothetical protein